INWLYCNGLRQMFGIYGPVLDGKLEKAFDDDIINSEFSPVRPIQNKKIPYLEESGTIRTKMEPTNNGWFNKWQRDGKQTALLEIDATEATTFKEWIVELKHEDLRLAKLSAAALRDPNPQALVIVQALLNGDTQETIGKRF